MGQSFHQAKVSSRLFLTWVTIFLLLLLLISRIFGGCALSQKVFSRITNLLSTLLLKTTELGKFSETPETCATVRSGPLMITRRRRCLHTKLLMEHSATTKWEKERIANFLKC